MQQDSAAAVCTSAQCVCVCVVTALFWTPVYVTLSEYLPTWVHQRGLVTQEEGIVGQHTLDFFFLDHFSTFFGRYSLDVSGFYIFSSRVLDLTFLR